MAFASREPSNRNMALQKAAEPTTLHVHAPLGGRTKSTAVENLELGQAAQRW